MSDRRRCIGLWLIPFFQITFPSYLTDYFVQKQSALHSFVLDMLEFNPLQIKNVWKSIILNMTRLVPYHSLNNVALQLFTQHLHRTGYYRQSRDDLQDTEGYAQGTQQGDSILCQGLEHPWIFVLYGGSWNQTTLDKYGLLQWFMLNIIL